MRKFFKLLMLALPMLLGLASCSESNNSANPNPLANKVSGLWWGLTNQEGSYSDATDTYYYTRVGHAICFNDNGTGYGIVFFFNDNQGDPIDIIGGEDMAPFTYTSTADGRLNLNFSNADREYADYLKQWAMSYSDGAVIATDGKQTLTMEKPSNSLAARIRDWDEQFNGGAESAPYHNINDKDFTADTWRKQTAIYLWDGTTRLTESNWQDPNNYNLVDLPWSGSSDVQTNLPNGFCDDITPENGWEWVLNRCGGSKIANNNFFAVYNKYSGTLRFFFYMPQQTKTIGNDHVWQVSLTNSLADECLWGYGLPSGETVKDRSKLSSVGVKEQVDYVAPWVEMKSDDGLIVPNEGWWAFDVDLSQYRPNHDISAESIRLQMRTWNSTHVSLYSTLTADISGSIQQTVKKASKASTIAKGVCIGIQAALGIASGIAGLASDDPKLTCQGLGNLANAIGCGAQMAGLFDDGKEPFAAQVSLGVNGKIDTDGLLKGSACVFEVPTPTLQMQDFYLNNTHLGQGVWNIKHHPVVHVFKDVKYFLWGGSGEYEPYNAFPYIFDPSSIEVELNPNVFPSDQIEWMQVDATCMAPKSIQGDGSAQYRTGLGLQPRDRGTSDFHIPSIEIQTFELFLTDYVWKYDPMPQFFDYLNYYSDKEQAEKAESPMYYPIYAWKKESYDYDNQFLLGRGQNDNFAIEPILFKQNGPGFAEMNDRDAEAKILLPDLSVNVVVTVKMKGIDKPFVFSRNYLPEFNDVKFSDMDDIANRIKSHNLSAKQNGHDYSYKYQVERIEKLFKNIKDWAQ